jgi:23S rRNA pseudouridine1911/1915/1917 synthase
LAGKVRVGGRVVVEPTARVRAGEEIVVDEHGRSPRPGELPKEAVVHVDAHVIVVSKPPGISTVPYEGEAEDTLDARVRRWLERGARKGGKGGGRPNLGVVHRLDKETSGLVVFTRTWLGKQRLAAQFRAHTVHRRYLAIAHGDVAPATIRTHLVEDRGDGLRGSARGRPPPGARLAVTHVARLEALRGATLVACTLETGRTHQIRIHLSESRHPILGDKVYSRGWSGVPIPAPRLMLHAAELGFVHPATEQPLSWEEPLPDDMREVLDRLRW